MINFRIDESSDCGDLYVYTKKKQIYLLKLEEIYETTTTTTQSVQTGTTPTLSTSQQNQSLLTTANSNNATQMSSVLFDDNSLVVNENSFDLNEKSINASLIKLNNQQQPQQQQSNRLGSTTGAMLSRRPSYASISDTSNDATLTTEKYTNKSQNLSGGIQATQSLTNTVTSSNQSASMPQKPNPE